MKTTLDLWNEMLVFSSNFGFFLLYFYFRQTRESSQSISFEKNKIGNILRVAIEEKLHPPAKDSFTDVVFRLCFSVSELFSSVNFLFLVVSGGEMVDETQCRHFASLSLWINRVKLLSTRRNEAPCRIDFI